jgi:hypothetical protein
MFDEIKLLIDEIENNISIDSYVDGKTLYSWYVDYTEDGSYRGLLDVLDDIREKLDDLNC